MTHRFAHEASFARDLAFMPMFVRYALDRVGRKIGLADWTALALAERRDCADDALAFGDGDARASSAFTARLELALARGSALLRNNVGAAGGSLDDAAWQRLSTFDRYALVKLGDRDEPSHDFAAALFELGLRAVHVGGGRVDAAVQGEVVPEHDA